MVKTIRVSEEYHQWIQAHNRDTETMEETLRRLTDGPAPHNVMGLLRNGDARTAKTAVEHLRSPNPDPDTQSQHATQASDNDDPSEK